MCTSTFRLGDGDKELLAKALENDAAIIEEFARHDPWLLSTAFAVGWPSTYDSKSHLEWFGFQVGQIVKGHGLYFYEVVPPKNWRKETVGHWTYIYDEKGVLQLLQFFAVFELDGPLALSHIGAVK